MNKLMPITIGIMPNKKIRVWADRHRQNDEFLLRNTMRSNTCKGSNNQFLEEYHSQTAANISADELKSMYGNDLIPFQCSRCGYWHLKTVNTRKQCHHCMDSSLFHKDIYSTKEEAQSTAAYLRKEKKVQLFPYRCPHGSGWHLTKNKG